MIYGLCRFGRGNHTISGETVLRVFRPLFSSRRLISNMTLKVLTIPEAVRGMTQLDERLFKKSVSFPALLVKGRDLNKIRGKVRLEKYLTKNLTNIKNVMDAEERDSKYLLFDPDAVREDDTDLKHSIIDQISQVVESPPSWDIKTIDLTFDNWDLRTVFRAILPAGLDFSSFTQTGHIVHCNFRDDLAPYKRIIGEILLRKVKQAKTIVNKADGIATQYRNFEIELVAGEGNYETSVVERGITYKMDFSKVFWNSRLQHEHERVLQFLTKDSLVFDACAGIGPFVLPAAKQKRCRLVYANDLNPESVSWLEKNREFNKIKPEQIKTFNLDAVEFIRGPVADQITKELKAGKDESQKAPDGIHIFMNLPAYSVNFLPAFKGMLHPKEVDERTLPPVWVYSYLFVKAHEDVPDEWYSERAHEMVKQKLGWEDATHDDRVSEHHVRTVSTRKEMFCMRISLSWNYLTADSTDGDEPPSKRTKTDE